MRRKTKNTCKDSHNIERARLSTIRLPEFASYYLTLNTLAGEKEGPHRTVGRRSASRISSASREPGQTKRTTRSSGSTETTRIFFTVTTVIGTRDGEPCSSCLDRRSNSSASGDRLPLEKSLPLLEGLARGGVLVSSESRGRTKEASVPLFPALRRFSLSNPTCTNSGENRVGIHSMKNLPEWQLETVR